MCARACVCVCVCVCACVCVCVCVCLSLWWGTHGGIVAQVLNYLYGIMSVKLNDWGARGARFPPRAYPLGAAHLI